MSILIESLDNAAWHAFGWWDAAIGALPLATLVVGSCMCRCDKAPCGVGNPLRVRSMLLSRADEIGLGLRQLNYPFDE